MKEWLKQMVCQHSWTDTKTINFCGYRIEVSECKKCGKVHATAKKL